MIHTFSLNLGTAVFVSLLSLNVSAQDMESVNVASLDPALYCTHGAKRAVGACVELNEVRLDRGLKPLRSSLKLTRIAYRYAQKLARLGKLTHGNFIDRMENEGVPAPAGENLARTESTAVGLWLDSPGHYANMIDRRYKIVGSAHYKGYYVQIYALSEG